jgi:hypothetical protein
MITGIERLNAAIKGEVLDRIPVFCNLLDQGAKELGLSLEEYYSKGNMSPKGKSECGKDTDTIMFGASFMLERKLNSWDARRFSSPKTVLLMYKIL